MSCAGRATVTSIVASAVMRSPPDCASLIRIADEVDPPQVPTKIGATPPAEVVSSAIDVSGVPAVGVARRWRHARCCRPGSSRQPVPLGNRRAGDRASSSRKAHVAGADQDPHRARRRSAAFAAMNLTTADAEGRGSSASAETAVVP